MGAILLGSMCLRRRNAHRMPIPDLMTQGSVFSGFHPPRCSSGDCGLACDSGPARRRLLFSLAENDESPFCAKGKVKSGNGPMCIIIPPSPHAEVRARTTSSDRLGSCDRLNSLWNPDGVTGVCTRNFICKRMRWLASPVICSSQPCF